jgi:hypothetical protein
MSVTSQTMALGSPPTQLLTRENTIVWKHLIIPTLCSARILDLVKGLDVVPPEEVEVDDIYGKKINVQNTEYVTWITRDQPVLRYILNSVSPNILFHVIVLKTSSEVWKTLDSLTTSQSRPRTQ